MLLLSFERINPKNNSEGDRQKCDLALSVLKTWTSVGPTHEEIDAFCGVYSGHLDFNDIFTMDGRCTQVFVVVAVITAN